MTDIISHIPVSIGDAATAIAGYVQKLGDGVPGLEAIAGKTTELAEITGSKLGPLVSSIGEVYRQWDIPNGDAMLKVQDQLYEASVKSGVPVQNLADELRQYAPIFKDIGYSETEALAQLAQFGRAGVDVATGTRGLKIAFAELTQIKTGEASTDGDLTAAENELAAAQQSVADAAQAVTDATTNLTKARTALAALQDGGRELAVQQALLREAQGVQSIAEARERQVEAQTALSKLTSGGLVAEALQAQDNIVDAENQLADATARAYDAQKKLQELLAGPTAQDQAKLGLAVTEATNAVTKATNDRANAERELRDAQQLGDAGLVVKATQDVADATAAQTKAQIDLTDATKAQSDAQLGSAASNDAISAAKRQAADAQQAAKEAAEAKKKAEADGVALAQAQSKELTDAQNAVTDATLATQGALLSLAQQRATDRANLGPDLSGQLLLQTAQDNVAKAALGTQDATQKLHDAQQKLSDTDDPVKGMAHIKKIIDDAGLSGASTKDQLTYLYQYIANSSDQEAAQTSIDLFGRRLGPDMEANIRQGTLAINGPGGLMKSLTDVGPVIDVIFNSTDLWNKELQKIKNLFATDFAPVATFALDAIITSAKILLTTLEGIVTTMGIITNGAASLRDAVPGGSTGTSVIGGVLSALPPVGIFGAVTGLFADGTDDAPGGLALVGERGPELVNLPPHSSVMPNGMTEKIIQGASMGQQGAKQFIANFYAPPAKPLDEGEIAVQLNRLQRLG